MNCVLCGAATSLVGVVSFNRDCSGHALPGGESIRYVQCENCNLVFAPQMCEWDRPTYKKRVYNSDYVKVDPDCTGRRPESNARWMHEMFGSQKISHLDYGGGDGMLSRLLRDWGWDSTSYDPMCDDVLPERKFDLVTAFEVFEHAPDPRRLWEELSQVSDNVVIFSTCLSDRVTDLLSWWYLAPRNGHVVLYSRKSLQRLVARSRFQILTVNDITHFAFRSVPPWLEAAIN